MLKQVFEKRMSLGEGINRMKMRDLRLYMLVGGMPQAVNEYLDTKNLQSVDMVKRQIIQLYADDFRKIDSTGRISKLFMAIPSQLSRNLMRYQPTPVVGNMPSAKIDELLLNLEDSKAINIAYHAEILRLECR